MSSFLSTAVCVILLVLAQTLSGDARPHHRRSSHQQHSLRTIQDDKLLEIVQTANIAAEMLLRSQPEVDVVTVFRDEKNPRSPSVTLRMNTDWCLLSKDMEQANCLVEAVGSKSCTIKCP